MNWRWPEAEDIELSRRPDNRKTTHKGAKVAAVPGYWGEITLRDKKMVDDGWHRFWAKRGSSPTKEELPVVVFDDGGDQTITVDVYSER